jgi:hypothetical protein
MRAAHALEPRVDIFNAINAPPPRATYGTFGAAAFGTITTDGATIRW